MHLDGLLLIPSRPIARTYRFRSMEDGLPTNTYLSVFRARVSFTEIHD
jgi:hypothetical protein